MRPVCFALLLAACGNARIIQMTPTGGTIELQDDRSKAMEQATGQMNQKCGPSNFTIVQEGWEPADPPAGQKTASNAMVWRLHFQCNGAVGSAQPLDQPPRAAPQPAAADPNPPTAAVPGY